MTKPYLRKSPPPIKQESFNLSVYGGGLNNVSGDVTIQDNQSTNNQNMMFISDEIMETRPGITAIDALTLTNPITFIDDYKPIDAAHSKVRASDSKVYVDSTEIDTVTDTIKGLNYIGKYYYVDGTKLKMYNGTKTYEIVEDAKSFSTVTIETSATTPITIALEDLDARTIVGTVIRHETVTAIETYTITAVDVATKTIQINVPITQKIEEGDMIRLYVPREKANYFEGQVKYDETLNLVWYEPCEYELEDSLKGENYIARNPHTIAIRGERLYISGDTNHPNYVYLSDVANPFYFPSYVSFQCPPNGDAVVDIVEFDDAMVVGRHSDIYAIYGVSPDLTSSNPFRMKKVDVHIGFMAKNCFAIINNLLFFLGYDSKFYRMTTPQTNIEYLTTKPLTNIIDIHKAPISIDPEKLNKISTIVYNNEFMMNIDGTVIVYSYNNRAFTFYKGWLSTSLYTDGLNVYIGRSDGKVAMWDKDVYSDLGVAIESIYETKRFDFGKTSNYKYFNQCIATTHAYEGTYSDIKLEYEIDFFYTAVAKIIRSAMSLFGIANWGDKFNDKEIMKSHWQMINARGRTIKLKFSTNAVNQPMRIYDINVIWSMRDFR